ncbi:glycosyltransferase family 2 protein [Dolosicoccus paucivorans]|uniref:Glycosyltransferase family 2 protein n=1 Tax=Dolosicoccus paucivorans TaxID=84521 RepID=A0A1G8LJE2_9LACT|nr:glycosyltransferase family 2 protein [Dolosicoccus paucivorans]PMB84638.1 glycosyltransferase family 2 protein [Dolosicoccus paucivorans]PMC59258.1 glycosyltransferase family 2 protein [Dolosicoccus paucivorans]SDI55849.1 teichuronic acid biosynthesis glycosyltransferase TuaG [Dolosicoccus paucivorans]
MEPLISVITPVYNAQEFIQETIESVQNQTFQQWEMILVNDQTPDNSVALIEELMQNDPRLKLIHLPENGGAAVARNAGLDEARGRYVAFIDSDDVWHPQKLEKQLEFMQENQYDFTYTNFALMTEEGDIRKDRVNLPLELGYYDLLKNTSIACSTVMIDRQKVGPFQMPLVRKGQDTATWLMLMRERGVKAYGLNEVLNYYRQVQGSISSNKFGALKRTWYLYHHLEGLPFLKASYYFLHYVVNAILRRI